MVVKAEGRMEGVEKGQNVGKNKGKSRKGKKVVEKDRGTAVEESF